MFDDLPGLAWLLAAIALCPAALLWWRRRALLRAPDDPALPERLLADQRRNGTAVGFAIAFVLIASPYSTYWTIPLLIAANIAASYPSRKVLYEETWSLGGYLWFTGRLLLGVWGFWIALAVFPYVPERAGSLDWLAALIFAVVLIAWNARYSDVLRYLLRSRPVHDDALARRFTAIGESSGIAMPRFEEVPLHGGAVANAIALPSLRGSAVLFTETLLARLEADEAAAICAHEVAHLEHFNPRLLRRLNAVTFLIIAAGVAVALLPRLAGWDSTLLSVAIWLIIIGGFVAWRTRDRQRNETASDLRAIALCGDAEVLVRGLTKLYAFARYPRRLDPEIERRATHPSLARRIRDIRAAAGIAPATLSDPAVFASLDGRAAITFQADRLYWTEGEVATHSLSYAHLAELRLRMKSRYGSSLVAVERGGRRWEIPLPAADVARLQAVLDVVDGQMTDPVSSRRLLPYPERIATAFAAIIALSLGQFAMAAAALIALLFPSAPLLAGAGMGALASAMGLFLTVPASGWNAQVGLALFPGAAGVALLAMAHARRGDDVRRPAMAGVAAFGILAAIATAVLVANGLDAVRLHLSAIAVPSTAVLLLATSGALAYLRSRPARYAAIPVALLGLVITAAGSPGFLDRYGRDPFLGHAGSISWRTVEGSVRAEFSVPFYVSQVTLSPAGRAVIVSAFSYDDEERTTEFHVGRPGARLTRIHAVNLMFASDDRVLGVYEDEEGSEVRETRVDTPELVVWRQRIPRIANPALTYHSAGQRWRAVGDNGRGGVVRLGGTIGSGTVEETRWPSRSEDRWPRAIAVSGDTALVVETAYVMPLLQETGWPLAFLLPGWRVESRFRTITADARHAVTVTPFDVYCVDAAAVDDRLVCSAFDGSRTRLAQIDPVTARVTPVAVLPGHFSGTAISSDGWLSGWLGSDAVAIRPSTHEGLRVTPTANDRVIQLAAHDDVVAVVFSSGKTSTVRLYPIGGIPR